MAALVSGTIAGPRRWRGPAAAVALPSVGPDFKALSASSFKSHVFSNEGYAPLVLPLLLQRVLAYLDKHIDHA